MLLRFEAKLSFGFTHPVGRSTLYHALTAWVNDRNYENKKMDMPKYMFRYDSINDHLILDGQDVKALLELVKYMKHIEQQLTTRNEW